MRSTVAIMPIGLRRSAERIVSWGIVGSLQRSGFKREGKAQLRLYHICLVPHKPPGKSYGGWRRARLASRSPRAPGFSPEAHLSQRHEGKAVPHEFDGLDGHPLQVAVLAEMERLTVYADAQELKVSQLQSALDSRVVIEQAKGMLAERFNIPFEDAFELLRTGARNTRQPMSAIAEELRESRQTPPEIRDLLPKDVQRE